MKKFLIVLLSVVVSAWLIYLTQEVINMNNKEEGSVAQYTVSGYSTDLSQIVDNNKSSVVSIETSDDISSGFIYKKIEDKLYIVTTLHGVDGFNDVEVTLNSGTKLYGSVINYDFYLDLALIECSFKNEVKAVTIGDSTLLKDGVFVLGIGTAGNEAYSFSSQFGMVSKSYREIENVVTYDEETYHYYCGYIQLSGEFISGYSGSPVFNMNGEVVGMIDQKDGEVVLATTINEIKMVTDKMINNEEYHRFNFGFTGKYVNELESYEKSHLNIGLETVDGYYIENIKLSSFASNIGLSKGDVIVEINDINIADQNSMLEATYNMNDTYSLVVIRNNEQIKFEGSIND